MAGKMCPFQSRLMAGYFLQGCGYGLRSPGSGFDLPGNIKSGLNPTPCKNRIRIRVRPYNTGSGQNSRIRSLNPHFLVSGRKKCGCCILHRFPLMTVITNHQQPLVYRPTFIHALQNGNGMEFVYLVLDTENYTARNSRSIAYLLLLLTIAEN